MDASFTSDLNFFLVNVVLYLYLRDVVPADNPQGFPAVMSIQYVARAACRARPMLRRYGRLRLGEPFLVVSWDFAPRSFLGC